jgi:F-type H+-transporting ATPase subunit epsilon
MAVLTLDIVTQEKRLLTAPVKSVTVDTVEGEITILPGHVPLLTRLSEGLLRFTDEKGTEDVVAIFGGFLEVGDDGKLTILADSAIRASDIDEAKVKAAQAAAQEALKDKSRQVEFAEAEASLRKAYVELKALNKGAKPRHSTA